MRIALVTEHWFSRYPASDGTTTTVKAVADRLIDLGHEVRLVAPGPGLTRYRNSRVVRISPLAQPGAQVRDALAEFDPDLVHVTDPGRIGRRALKHAERMELRSLVVQQSPVGRATEDLWVSRVAERADDVVVTAGWMVEALARLGVVAALWRPGVDGHAFTPALRDPWLHGKWAREGRVVVGYAGALARRHDVRELALLSGVPGIRVVLIGDGTQRGWLADRLPGAKLVGPLGTGDLAIALASLDVVVHPGRSETCCHVLREAGASGVPVVAPRSGGAGELVRNLETGLLYDADTPGGPAEAVASLAADPRRSYLGARARELALERSWTRAVDELIDALVTCR
ncbi:glycosyltransferase [Nocardioides sp. CER19]|uniref:glycosyltransferase n=1 Tax=Nocardioides sp. CER19 TaxID=3038538 RepID=UPI002448D475|nr:glycosyltransferase [Nocardioides sp. CER19]MDH2413681.1 glycosyltransferase [Nocardioides sp. CER19]